MKATISSIFEIDSAHHLPNYPGKCANIHGHHWTIEVSITGEILEADGMVLDFTELKKVINPLIDSLDHNDLNNILETPTAENIAVYILNYLLRNFLTHIYKFKVKVGETPKNFAEVTS